ncbi:MAG TPA: Holliday junction resolvase RuvX [Steroidobacteraceae bacterium]|jgi:putative Holliday junction resolvase|nr:Holliday junction resolvase RuvX [Steroidobacteraceae bacterium]
MPEAQARVVLAFDFGLRRIGVASGDTVSNAAAPRSAIQVTERGIDWPAIERLLREYQPQLLVVGSPRHADGTASGLSQRADQFAAALAARAQRPVHRADEFASSIEAAAELASQRASGQRRRRVQHADIDSAAAAIILERWLRGEGRTDD